MTNDPLTHFLRAARRRLWLEAILRQLRIALLVSAVVLVALSIVHTGWGPLGFGFSVGIALLAGALALSPSLFVRPTLSECAIRADRHFDGHSLITTAHELRATADSQPAVRTVLAQARSRVAEWLPRLGTFWQAPHGSSFMLAVVPALVAALLLQLPARDDSFAATRYEIAGPFAGLGTATDPSDATAGLPELRDAIAKNTIQEQGSTRAENASSDSGLPTPGDVQPQSAPQRLETEIADDSQAGFASASNAGGQSPGDARRGKGESGQQLRRSKPQFSGRLDTTIERYGSVVAGRESSGDEFAGEVQRTSNASADTAPAPAPLTSSAWTTLTAAEVAYAKRYLDAAEAQRD